MKRYQIAAGNAYNKLIAMLEVIFIVICAGCVIGFTFCLTLFAFAVNFRWFILTVVVLLIAWSYIP